MLYMICSEKKVQISDPPNQNLDQSGTLIPPSPHHNHTPTTKPNNDKSIVSDNTPTHTAKVTLNCLRCDFIITVPKNIHPNKAIPTVFKNIFDQMKDINSTFQIYLGVKKSTASILKTSQKPHLLNNVLVYFPGIQPQQDRGIYYTKIRLGFIEEFRDFNVNLNSWMNGEWHCLYKCLLQVEKTIEIGWLTNTLNVMKTPFFTAI